MKNIYKIAVILLLSLSFKTSAQQTIIHNLKAFVNSSATNAIQADGIRLTACVGDVIRFEAAPTFPNSLEVTGAGYSQTVANTTLQWTLSNGVQFGNLPSINYTVSNATGFSVRCRITDSQNNFFDQVLQVMVGTTPNFSGISAVPSPICLGNELRLNGGFNATTGAATGFSIPENAIGISGAVAGTTHIPDIPVGGLPQIYSTTVNISGFDPGKTLSASCGIESICLNMEHSFIGDISVTITCPNGSVATLFDMFASDNSNAFDLGRPFVLNNSESNSNTPGQGSNYCFSDYGSKTIAQACLPSTTANPNVTANPGVSIDATRPTQTYSLNEGTYKPSTPFPAQLAGCPLNGNWTIKVKDNQSTDDGYIFSWGINFAPCNYDADNRYQNTVIAGNWINVNPITSQSSTVTNTIAQANVSDYKFQIKDNFGCLHDTIVKVNVVNQTLNLANKELFLCDSVKSISGNTATVNGGTWTVLGNPNPAPVITVNPANTINPRISVPNHNTFTFVYTDNTCNKKDTLKITWLRKPNFNLDTNLYACPGKKIQLMVKDSVNMSGIEWASLPAGTTISNNYSVNLGEGTYEVTLSPLLNSSCFKDTTFTVKSQAPIKINYLDFNYPGIKCDNINDGSDTIVMQSNTGIQTGNWSCYDCPGNPVYKRQDSLNTSIYLPTYGTYQLIFTENKCQDDDTLEIKLMPSPWIDLFDYKICQGVAHTIEPFYYQLPYVDNIVWNTGETTENIKVTEAGYYHVTASNICGQYTDSSLVTVKICDIQVPNTFSPNSDGSNEVFKLLGEDFDFFKSFSIAITNRWGNIVFEAKKPEFVWDGKDKQGNVVEDGVYFYHIRSTTIENEPLTKQGFIQVFTQK